MLYRGNSQGHLHPLQSWVLIDGIIDKNIGKCGLFPVEVHRWWVETSNKQTIDNEEDNQEVDGFVPHWWNLYLEVFPKKFQIRRCKQQGGKVMAFP